MLNNQEIETGDTVTMISEPSLNGGVAMSVVETEGDQVKISYFDANSVNQEKWVEKKDLLIVQKVQGGFRNEGEQP